MVTENLNQNLHYKKNKKKKNSMPMISQLSLA